MRTIFPLSLLLVALPTVVAARTRKLDPIFAAGRGLTAVIEDDLKRGEGEPRLIGISSKGCTTLMQAKGRSWTLDWTKIETLEPEDTFVFVAGPGVRLAIVGDASIPAQAAKLKALANAMKAAKARCGAKG